MNEWCAREGQRTRAHKQGDVVSMSVRATGAAAKVNHQTVELVSSCNMLAITHTSQNCEEACAF
jgi:hypothetical protein